MTITKLSSSQAKKRTSLRERVSEAEWKVRTDLAAAYQLAVVYGWTDMDQLRSGLTVADVVVPRAIPKQAKQLPILFR